MAYSLEQIDKSMREVCGRIAAGQTLREICEPKNPDLPESPDNPRANPHLPRKSTILRWTSSQKKEMKVIHDRYSRAQTARAAAWAEEIVDTGRKSTIVTAHADRVKIEALKWAAARADPNKFGDRQQISLDAKVESLPAQDKAPDWMRSRLEPETPGEAVSTALGAALQGKPEGVTKH